MHIKNMLLLATAVIMGLTAGIFYCWSVSVTRGFALLPDKEYITAFQSLNRAILNPLFFICFMGTAVLLPASAWACYSHTSPARFWLLAAAAVIYLAGVMGVTMAGNVPMNEALDAFNTHTAPAAEISARRIAFEGRWNFLNHIRSLSCILCLALTVLACMLSASGVPVFGLPSPKQVRHENVSGYPAADRGNAFIVSPPAGGTAAPRTLG